MEQEDFLRPKCILIEALNTDCHKGCWYEKLLPCDERSELIKMGDIVEIYGEKYGIAGCGSATVNGEPVQKFLAFGFKEGKRPEWMERKYPRPDYHNIDSLFQDDNPFGEVVLH